MPTTRAAPGWVTLDVDADEQEAPSLSEHKHRLHRPADPFRYSEGHRLRCVASLSCMTAALSDGIPVQFNLSHLLKKHHWNSQLLNCSCLWQHPVQERPPLSQPFLEIIELTSCNMSLLTLLYWGASHTPRECVLLASACEITRGSDSTLSSFVSGCYELMMDTKGCPLSVVSKKHVQVFLWLVQVYQSTLFSG